MYDQEVATLAKKVVAGPENERMQQVRLALGYPDRTAFSTKVGIERSAYIKMETGPSKPSMESLQKIKAVFKRFNLNFMADPKEPVLLPEIAQGQLPPVLPPAVREGLPTTPGTATPQEADFVGRLINQLEAENARKDELIQWLQEQNAQLLKKPLASSDAAAFMFTEATPISLRPTACVAATAPQQPVAAECVVREMYPKQKQVAKVA